MRISEAQREVRTIYVGGFVGQLVSSAVWFASAAIGATVGPKAGFWALALGGATIFLLTQSILIMAGRRAMLAKRNPLGPLAMQIAFTVPFVLPVAAAASLYRPGWFYPGWLVIVGAHYLPFVFLYGMKTFAALAAAMIGAGYAIGVYAPGAVLLGGWAGGAILFGFAFALLAAYRAGAVDHGSRMVPD